MRFIILMLLFAWGQSACSQDSVYLKVTKVKGNKYWLKDTTGHKYKTKCDCKHEVGEVVVVAIKDLFKPKK